MDTEFLHIKQLSMLLQTRAIFDQVDFAIAEGDAVAVIGANGSGKTTLLKILGGLLKPSTGTVSIAGMQYNNSKLQLKIRELIGFAPDCPPLYPNDTVNSYLNFIAKLKLVPKQHLKAQIDACLDIFDLGAVRNFYIGNLSKGTQQRINLAQALLNSPKILILDEPTNALDGQQCENFCKHLKLLKDQKTTIIIASHQYNEIIPLCDYMLRLNNSTVQKIMTPLNNKDIKQTNDQIYYST